MSWYVASAVLLTASTLLAFVTGMRWPKTGRDVSVALLAGGSVALWIVVSAARPSTGLPLGLTVADLVAVPGLMLGSLLMGRTVILVRQRVRAEARAQADAERDAIRAAATKRAVEAADRTDPAAGSE